MTHCEVHPCRNSRLCIGSPDDQLGGPGEEPTIEGLDGLAAPGTAGYHFSSHPAG